MDINNIAIVGNPCGIGEKISTDGTYKVAKMSNLDKTPKIQNLLKRWQNELAKVAVVSNQVKATVTEKVTKGIDVLNDANANVKDFFYNSFRNGARKLKVKKFVADKSLNTYGIHEGIVLKVEEPQKEVVSENNINYVNTYANMTARKELAGDKPMMDSRLSRLERTGEMPVVSEPREMKRSENVYDNPVINTPTRFERYNETPFDALINDNANVSSVPVENNFENRERSFETKGGDPNLYSKLIHGATNSNIDEELIRAQKERDEARRINEETLAYLEELKRKVQENELIIRQQEEKEEQTKRALIEEANQEALGLTKNFRDLTNQVSKYEKMLHDQEARLNGSGYSRGKSI